MAQNLILKRTVDHTITFPRQNKLLTISVSIQWLTESPFAKVVGGIAGCLIRIKPIVVSITLRENCFIRLQTVCVTTSNCLQTHSLDTQVLPTIEKPWKTALCMFSDYTDMNVIVFYGTVIYPCMSWPVVLITPSKTRWRIIFSKALDMKPAFVANVIPRCTILRNVCQRNGDSMEPPENGPPPSSGWNFGHHHSLKKSIQMISLHYLKSPFTMAQ